MSCGSAGFSPTASPVGCGATKAAPCRPSFKRAQVQKTISPSLTRRSRSLAPGNAYTRTTPVLISATYTNDLERLLVDPTFRTSPSPVTIRNLGEVGTEILNCLAASARSAFTLRVNAFWKSGADREITAAERRALWESR